MPLSVEHLLRTAATLERHWKKTSTEEILFDLYRNAAIKSSTGS